MSSTAVPTSTPAGIAPAGTSMGGDGSVPQAAVAAAAAAPAPVPPSGGGGGGGGGATLDIASVLAKIQALEKEKADMRAQLETTSARLSKLQESKRAEMEQMMNSTITKWLESLETTDKTAKDQLRDGLNRLVQSGDESGVWNVIACASNSWVSNVNQIEQLTSQLNEYKEKERLLSGGIFQSEESRVAPSSHAGISHASASVHSGYAGEKRKADGISPADVFSELQGMIMMGGGNVGYDHGLFTSVSRGGEEIGRD